jgi:ketosteroid isomerase-like protein
LCTTLLMSDQLGGDELIISNYDQDLGFNVGAALRFFRDENADFGVISFNSIHPKWSYVRISDTGAVIEAAEKNPISKDALVGLYYFRSSDEFIDAAKRTILAAPADKEQFFISEVINTLVLAGMAGVCYKIEREEYRNFYDSSELKDFIERAKAKEKSADDILANTKKYISAFAARDLAAISDLMENNAILYDSSAGEVKSRDNIIQFVEQLFSSHETLSFEEKRVIVEGQRSVIEFVLKLDSLMIRGVDIIDWHNGKIQRIDAYLEVL